MKANFKREEKRYKNKHNIRRERGKTGPFCPGWSIHPGLKVGRGLGIFPARPKTSFVPGGGFTRDKSPPHIFPSSFALPLTLGFSSAPGATAVLLAPPREPSTAAIDVAAAQSPDLTPPPRATAAAVTPRPRHHPLLAVDPPLQAIPAHAAYPKVELDLVPSNTEH